MSTLGPSKLILINSGPYDYAEVDLDRSGHLVGENNVGKTSLISVLQFLYMAEQRDMRFSEDLDASRAFYFRTEQSYIVFELNTPEGVKCLLVQGLGPAQMHSFERWVYNGPYRREHYLDGRRVRKPSEILRELAADSDPRKLKPAELRQALTGLSRKSGVPLLGIVPVKQSENYTRFLSVFRNLIHLDRVRQHELKNLFIEISRGQIPSTEINLAEKYGSLFDTLRRDTNTQGAFEHVRVSITAALDADGRRRHWRGQLAPLWTRYKELFEAETRTLAEQIRTATDTGGRLEEELAALVRRNQELADSHGELSEHLGAVKGRLGTLEDKDRELNELDEEFERNTLKVTEHKLEQARRRLYAAEAVDSTERIQRRLDENRARQAELQQRLNNAERLLATWLRQLYDDHQLGDLFRLVNPALLGQPVDGNGVQIHDQAALRRRIDALLARIEDQRYSDPDITIALQNMPAESLEAFSDPAAMRQRLQDVEAASRDATAALVAARNRADLEAAVKELQDQLSATRSNLAAFDQLREMRTRATEWQAEQRMLEPQIDQLREELKALEDQRAQLQRNVEENHAQLKKLNEQDSDLRDSHRSLFDRMNQKPERFDWPPEATDWQPDSAKEACETVLNALDREEAESRKVAEALERISRQPQHTRFMGEGPEAERLQQLRERTEAAEEERAALQRRWAGLLKGLAQEASQLLAGLDVLDRECQRLNTRISKLAISNLKGFTVRAEPNRELLAQLNALRDYGAEQTTFSFGADEQLDIAEALERVDQALRQRPTIRLADAFELAFDVTLASGQTRSYAQLSQIQSNGTTVTIKVVINLLLLRGLLDPKRIATVPFYLDEVAQLSINNVQSIIGLARSQHCFPILASPSELEAADVLYLLKPTTNGRLVLTEDHRVELRRATQADQAEAVNV
ncbi:MAG: hypothetical protein LAT50_12340 [Ectothiorhodospiraceae bacterium]|nr:hypothetical protein [Ectothiorhodospiraceae bacterium]